MVVDAIALAGAGVIGIVGGLGISLLIKGQKRRVPQMGAEGHWQKLRRLTHERAEASARQQALQKAFAAKAMDEGAYITKEAHYAKIIDSIDDEIEAIIGQLSGEFVKSEKAAGEARVRQLGDVGSMAAEAARLKEMKQELELEKDQLHVQLSEAEDDKKAHLAEKNRLREKYEEASWRVKALEDRLSQVEKDKKGAETRAKAYEDKGSVRNLVEENRRLRQGLARAKDKLSLTKNEVAIMSALVDKYAAEIEGKELRTPTQMKALITPEDPDVMRLAKEMGTGPEAFRFVRDNIREVHPSINATYWLKPAEVLRIGGADHEDRVILLCSLLRALGLEAKVVTVEMQNKMTRSVVGLDDRVLDPRRHATWSDYEDLSTEAALRRYAFDGFGVRKVLAEFNDQAYRRV
jgi:hypothetical protein